MDQRINMSSLLTSSGIPDARSRVSDMMSRMLEAQETPLEPQAPVSSTPIPAHFSALVPSIISLKCQILSELESNLPKLLTLNPSRREAVAQHLDRLAGGTPTADAAGQGLRRWMEANRTRAQTLALQSFFEELALIVLGQALLMKAWSDRGLRTWSEADLGRLNWTLSTALKGHLPLDRDGWVITRPNLYSWYNPSPALQHEIWTSFKSFRITDEGPGLLISVLALAKQVETDGFEPRGYDARLFESIWEVIRSRHDQPDSSHFKRRKTTFSPTLRDGAMVRTGPIDINWVGLESAPYSLMLAELVQLWWGPAAPPLWGTGNGLEIHSRDQLSLALTSGKPTLLNRIAEMEAADWSFVLEERPIRTQGRGVEATQFRESVESLPYFKKLKASGTTLGTLQACVAITKLRPGGLLWWAREETLSENEGNEALNFFLERARILCEWDFTDLEHALPSSVPLFPRHLYLLAREPELEARLTHRPVRITVQGQIRSHVEVPVMLQDAFHSLHKTMQPRGQWTIHAQQSPTCQHEWADRWPTPASLGVLKTLDTLRQCSIPMANVATVRATPPGDPRYGNCWMIHDTLKGVWVHAEGNKETRKLVVAPLPRRGMEASGSGFLILVPNDTWVAPLRAYLESSLVHTWLDHHAERKNERWALTEQIVKWIPVPKSLLKWLGGEGTTSAFAMPLPGDWEKTASELQYNPAQVRESLQKLGSLPAEEALEIRAALFVRAAQALEHMSREHKKLLNMVSAQGRIRWRELIEILPKNECTSLTLHPRIRMMGNLPSHLPIGRIDRVKTPSAGLMFATDSGFSLQIVSDVPILIDMLSEQLEGLNYPTWSELVGFLRLPRRLEIAETTANDLLRSHGEQSSRIRELEALLSACTLL